MNSSHIMAYYDFGPLLTLSNGCSLVQLRGHSYLVRLRQQNDLCLVNKTAWLGLEKHLALCYNNISQLKKETWPHTGCKPQSPRRKNLLLIWLCLRSTSKNDTTWVTIASNLEVQGSWSGWHVGSKNRLPQGRLRRGIFSSLQSVTWC